MCTATSGAQDGTTISAVVPDTKAELTPPDPALVEELAIANRILFRQGVVDAFGHISVRHDKRPDRYLLARNMAPALVTPNDIVEFDLDSNPLTANGRSVYLERFIHGEIYRTRPDVIAVVHSHSPAVVPFGIVKSVAFRPVCHHSHSPAVVPFGIVKSVAFRPVCHMSGFISDATPIFEIRDVAGDSSDLLVRDHKLGAALAKTLGSGSVVLMRGHGSTAVGNSIRQAVYRAVYTEINARLQSEAMRLGPVTYLTVGEARTADVNVGTQINRAWDFWRMQAEGKV